MPGKALCALLSLCLATFAGCTPLASTGQGADKANLASYSYYKTATPEKVRADSKGGVGRANSQVNTIKGITPLMAAADSSPYPEVIEILIAAGQRVNARTSSRSRGYIYPGDNQTALHFAVNNPNPAIIRTLLRHGAEPNARDGFGETPLYQACVGEDGDGVCPQRLEHVRALLEGGASPDTYDAGKEYNALTMAIYQGQQEKALLMLPLADLESRNRRGDTPLLIALDHKQPAIALDLLKAGANSGWSNKSGENALVIAIQKIPNLEASLLDRLLEQADVNETDKWGRTPLYWACSEGGPGVARLLLERGADLSGGTKSYMGAAIASQQANREAVALALLEHGQDPNSGWALHWACAYSKPKIVEALLRKGADPNLATEGGDTPLMMALWRPESLACLALLVRYGAKVNAVNARGFSALLYALRAPSSEEMEDAQPELMAFLIRHGARVNDLYPCGETPLTYLVGEEARGALPEAYIPLLIKAGANPNKPNAAGKTPLQVAGFEAWKEALRKHGALK